MFTYPRDLLPRVRSVWRLRRSQRKQTPRLPPGDRLGRFLAVAFHASLLSEEDRKTRFRLALISSQAAFAEAGASGVHQKFDIVQFAVPRSFSVNEVLRLAPAADVTRTLICVEPAHHGSSRRESFQIWGLLHTGSSWWEFTHGECAIGVPPPNCLTVSSTEPGNLTISHEGDVLLGLKRGEIVSPSGDVMYRGPIARFLRGAQKALYHTACQELGSARFDPTGTDDHYPKYAYNNYLERLLFHIREKQHGGTVLIVPDELDLASPLLLKRLLVKYPSTYDNAWSLLVSSLSLRRKYFDLYIPLWNRKTPIPVEHYQQISLIQNEREEIERRISDSVTLLASTSGVDGAVLMTDRFRLLGFGAEVIAASTELKKVQLARDPAARSTSATAIEDFGTRHRSAYRFCSSLEDSVAFVVSQDGGVKAVKRVGDQLIVWPDISFGPLGI